MAALREILKFLCIPFTILITGFTTIGFLAAKISPVELSITSFAGLSLPLLLFIDLILCLYWGLRRRWWVILPVGAIFLNMNYITAIFRYSLTEFPVSKGKEIKIATYNVLSFQSSSATSFQKEITEFLQQKEIDIICFQEYCETSRVNRDSLAQLLKWLPYRTVFQIDGDTNSTYGIAIYSRFPIISAGAISFNSKVNTAGWCDLLLEQDTIRLFNLHLQTTNYNQKIRKYLNLRTFSTLEFEKKAINNSFEVLQDNFKQRSQQADKVRQMIDSTHYPVLICGDFNDTPGSYAYHRVKGKCKDGFKEVGEGYAYTFQGIQQLLRIDYILYSEEFIGVHYLSPSLLWSDHNPVVMTIIYLPPLSKISENFR